jgi:hypothetical protein
MEGDDDEHVEPDVATAESPSRDPSQHGGGGGHDENNGSDRSTSSENEDDGSTDDDEDSDDEDSVENGHTSSRSRRSSASHWSASRRSSPPPELPVSPLLPSRRQSASAGSEGRMSIGIRRSSSRASGGVVSFEDDDDPITDDESVEDGDQGRGTRNGELQDGDIEPLQLAEVEAAFPTLPAFVSASVIRETTT